MNPDFAALGFEIRTDAVHSSSLERLRSEFDLSAPGQRRFDGSGLSGEIAINELRGIARRYLGDRARPVRLILFDKTAGANWNLGWHQDRVIAVNQRAEVSGFSNWSRKHGAIHVEPPFDIIGRMVTIRLHCDDCRADNGALEVMPGSHRLGRLDDAATRALVQNEPGKTLECGAGTVAVLATSIVHRSRPSISSKHRRVIHVDYSAEELAEPLDWAFSLKKAE